MEKSFCGKCGSETEDSDSFCTKCGEKKHNTSIPSDFTTEPRPKSTTWALWLLPLFGAFVGGLLMYMIVVNDDKTKAQNGLIVGFSISVFFAIVALILSDVTI